MMQPQVESFLRCERRNGAGLSFSFFVDFGGLNPLCRVAREYLRGAVPAFVKNERIVMFDRRKEARVLSGSQLEGQGLRSIRPDACQGIHTEGGRKPYCGLVRAASAPRHGDVVMHSSAGPNCKHRSHATENWPANFSCPIARFAHGPDGVDSVTEWIGGRANSKTASSDDALIQILMWAYRNRLPAFSEEFSRIRNAGIVAYLALYEIHVQCHVSLPVNAIQGPVHFGRQG